jgi:hypothetical protein
MTNFAKLRVLSEEADNEREYTLTDKINVIGRQPDLYPDKNVEVNPVEINSTFKDTSRLHAIIRIDENNRCLLVDLESTNGVWINRDDDIVTSNSIRSKSKDSSTPIRRITPGIEIPLFNNDIIFFGHPGDPKAVYAQIKFEMDKDNKGCKNKFPIIFPYCPHCGVISHSHLKNSTENDKDDNGQEFADNVYSDRSEEGDILIDATATLKFQQGEGADGSFVSPMSKFSSTPKIIQITKCFNPICSLTYPSNFPFCPYCGSQNCAIDVHIPCINSDCEASFRDSNGVCPICKKQNPTSKKDARKGYPYHNMCDDLVKIESKSSDEKNVKDDNIENDKPIIDKDTKTDSHTQSLQLGPNFYRILTLLADKYHKKGGIESVIKKDKPLKQQLSTILNEVGIDKKSLLDQLNKIIKTNNETLLNSENTIKNICNKLLENDLVSSVMVSTDTTNVNDKRSRLFYIIKDKNYGEFLEADIERMEKKLKEMKSHLEETKR